MRHANLLPVLFSLMMVPTFLAGQPAPRAPLADEEPELLKVVPREHTNEDKYPSNVGAVNEGGGTANTNGMNNGLSPNSSGSGTNNSRAGDTSGFSFGEGAPKNDGKGSVQQGE